MEDPLHQETLHLTRLPVCNFRLPTGRTVVDFSHPVYTGLTVVKLYIVGPFVLHPLSYQRKHQQSGSLWVLKVERHAVTIAKLHWPIHHQKELVCGADYGSPFAL